MKNNELKKSFFTSILTVKNLIIGALTSVALKLFSDRAADYDLFGHLKIGELLLGNINLIKTELFSFTAKDALVVNHEWISQIILSNIHTNFGSAGLILLKVAIGMIASLLVFKTIGARTKNIIVTILVFMLAVQAISRGFLFRPQIFSYLFFALLAYIIAKYKDNNKLLYIIPAIFLLWANMHGAFIAGLAFLGLFFISESYSLYINDKRGFWRSKEFKTLATVFILSFIVTFINPYGIRLYYYIAYEMGLDISKQYITEWQSFSFAARELPFLILLILYIISLAIRRREITLRDILIPGAAGLLGLASVRHTPIFAIMATETISDGLSRAMKRMNIGENIKDSGNKAECAVKLILITVMVAFIYLSSGADLPARWAIYLKNDPYPVYTVKFIKENRMKGNLWLPHNYGMYALYNLYPECKVSIDGRWATVYSEEIMRDSMDFSFGDDIERKFEILKKYDPDFIITEPENLINDQLIKSDKYKFIFGDYAGNLFVRSDYKFVSQVKYPKKQKCFLFW